MAEHARQSPERTLRADLVCGLCARTAARVEGTWAGRFVPRRIWVSDAEHAAVVRRLRCPHCRGHLTLDNQEEIATTCEPPPEWGPHHGGRPRRSRPGDVGEVVS